MATAEWEEDQWELIINADGFVYKRKKRRRLNPTSASSSAPPPPPPDPAAEEKNRRERKKRALTKLRDKYQKEIDQWEHLSNMLRALQEKSQNQQQCDEQTPPPPPSLSEKSSDTGGERLLDDLLRRAETEEAVIQSVSNLCDMAEAICNLQEESMKQSLLDLPVWASPHELLSSLCDN